MTGKAEGRASVRASRWRLEIDHATAFEYDAPVRFSYNETRLVPADDGRQTTISARVTTTPAARQYRYTDYWGTTVVAFDVPEQHVSLEIRLGAVVDTLDASQSSGDSAPWDDLETAAGDLAELLAPTRFTAVTPDLAAIAAAKRANTPRATAEAIAAFVHEAIVYEKGVTGVHTPAAEAFAKGRGVCQDIAHLTIALMRCAGIPARYVSGYIHPSKEPVVGEPTAGQSHAWVDAWTGAWWSIDPTNLVVPGRRHVVVARGRDYADVAPVRGIYAGSADNTMSTTVTVTRTS